LGKAVGAADEESEVGCPAIAPLSELLRESGAGQAPAALVEGDKDGAGGRRGEEQRGFALLELGRRQGPLLLDLADGQRPSEALGIMTRERGMRACLQLADGDDVQAHASPRDLRAQANTMAGSPSVAPHIFSRL